MLSDLVLITKTTRVDNLQKVRIFPEDIMPDCPDDKKYQQFRLGVNYFEK